MNILRQSGLLFWKNLLLRVRYPVIAILEVLWPILIIGMVSLMRHGSPPVKKPNCHYETRAMPSVGAAPFVQTFVCNINNACRLTQTQILTSEKFSNEISAQTEELGTYLSDPTVLEVLKTADKSAEVFKTITNVVGDTQLMEGLETILYVKSYFRDPEKVKQIFMTDLGLSEKSAQVLLDARVDVGQILNLTGTPDIKRIACDPVLLESYVKFPKGASIYNISRALCMVTSDGADKLTNKILNELNVTTIVNAVKLFENLKEKLGVENTLGPVFDSIARMLELVMSSSSLKDILKGFGAVPEIADLIRNMPDWIKRFTTFEKGIHSMKDIIESLEPLMRKLKVDKSNIWLAVKNSVEMGVNIFDLTEGNWNGTSESFIQPLVGLTHNVEDLAQDETGRQAAVVLQFLSSVNWLQIYYDSTNGQSLSDQSILNLLKAGQTMLERFPTWPDIVKVARIMDHSLDVMQILTSKSIDIRCKLMTLFQSNSKFQAQVNKAIQWGPVVIRKVIESAVKSRFINDLLSGDRDYSSMCEKVLDHVKSDIPMDVYQDMHSTLCGDDAMGVLEKILSQFQLQEIRDSINETVDAIESLYSNKEFYPSSINLTSVYYKYKTYRQTYDSYTHGRCPWEGFYTLLRNADIEISQDDWEPVLDILNEDLIPTGLFSGFQLVAGIVVTTDKSGNLAPTIHLINRVVKLAYDAMLDLSYITSEDSKILQAVNYVTVYLPQIIDGVDYLWHNDMDSLYKLASSDKPFDTFCDDDYLTKLHLPASVPVDRMTELSCATNWELVVQDFTNLGRDISLLTDQINNFGTPSGGPYDPEQDWADILDNSERIFDLFMSGTYLGFRTDRGAMEIFSQVDLSHVSEGFDVLLKKLQKYSNDDTDKLSRLSMNILEHFMDSKTLNNLMDVTDAFLDMQIETLETYNLNFNSLEQILKQVPPTIREMTAKLAAAYPEFVTSMKNIISDPQKFIKKVVDKGMHLPDCSEYQLSDYFPLPANSKVLEFEKYICDLNYTALGQEVMDVQPTASRFTEKVEAFLNGHLQSPKVNLTSLIEKVQNYVDLLEQDMDSNFGTSGFNWAPFNVSAIDMAWSTFYDALKTLQTNETRITELISVINSQVLGSLSAAFNDSSLANFINSENYVIYHFTEMLIKELQYFNETNQIVLLDYFGLPEVEDLLLTSPEINAVGVATINRLITNPQDVVIETDLKKLCDDLTLFSKVFVLSAGRPASPRDIQQKVCSLDIDFERRLQDFVEKRQSIKKFADQLKIFDSSYSQSDIEVSMTELVNKYTEMSSLLTDMTLNGFQVKLTSRDQTLVIDTFVDSWKDLYHNLTEFLGAQFDSFSGVLSWESRIVDVVIRTLSSVPNSQDILNYASVVLDVLNEQMEQSYDGIGSLRKYPNGNKLINLLNQGPEAVQTILYTVFTQQDKTRNWGAAMQSWDKFCETPSLDILVAPPQLSSFNVSDFLATVCSMDWEELLKELEQNQATSRLEKLLTGGDLPNVNTSSVVDKSKKLFNTLDKLFSRTDIDTNTGYLRLFDANAWRNVDKRIASWTSNSSLTSELSTKSVAEIVQSVLKSFIESMDTSDALDQAIAATDVIIDELLRIINSNGYSDAFLELPNVQTIFRLLNRLPDLVETIEYTSIFHPEKVTIRINELSKVASLDEFCQLDPLTMLTVPPSSTFDLRDFFQQLCSLNTSSILDELTQFSAAQDIQDIMEKNKKTTADIPSLVQKAETLINKLQEDLWITHERIFDKSAWQGVFTRLEEWILPKDTMAFIKRQQSVAVQGLILYLDNTPGSQDMLQYVDAVMDIIGDRIELSKQSVSKPFEDFPTIETILELLDRAPEMLETALYTVLAKPEQTSRWSQALQSFGQFCNTPVSDIMTVPPGSSFDLNSYLSKLCSVDIDNLVDEINEYQGNNKLQGIMSGNYTAPINASAIIDKMDRIIESFNTYVEDPLSSAFTELRLFNQTVWEEVGDRINQWSGSSEMTYSGNNAISAIFEELYGAVLSQSRDLQEAYDKAVAVADVLVSHILDIVEAGLLSEAVKGVPSLEKVFDLANYIPELLETVMYTSLYHSEKVSSRSQSLTSFDSFCSTKAGDMFTVPKDIIFDIQIWIDELCSLNLTSLENDINNFKLMNDIISVVTSSSHHSNISSVVWKYDRLMSKLNSGVSFGDRIFQKSLWKEVADNAEKWMEESSQVDPLTTLNGVFGVIQELQNSNPELRELIRPLGVTGVIFNTVIDSILVLENRTEVGLHDVFTRWPNIEKFVELLQQPGVIQVFTASYSSSNFLQLFSNGSSRSDLCSSSTDPRKYFLLPKGTSFNLNQIRDTFCAVDFDNFVSGYDNFINLRTLERVANGSELFDWSHITSKISRLVKMFEHPPRLVLPDQWSNETYWLDLLGDTVPGGLQISTTRTQAQNILNQLKPLLTLDGFKQVGFVLNNLLSILNENIVSMTGTDYTLGAVIHKIPALRDLFGAFGLDDKAFDTFLLSTVENTTQLVNLITSDDLKQDFCQTNKWKEILGFPANFDSSALKTAVCLENIDPLLEKLEENFNLTSIIDTLTDENHVYYFNDWKSALDKVLDLADNIQKLITNPPTVSGDEIESRLRDSFIMDKIWKLLPALSALEQIFGTNSEIINIFGKDTISPFKNIFLAANAVVHFLDNGLARVRVKGGRLDLVSLFREVPEFVSIIDGILDVHPDPITGLFSVELKPSKIDKFIDTASNSKKLNSLFCSQTEFEELFTIRNNANISSMLSAVCDLDFEPIAEKLRKSFKYNDLMDDLKSAFSGNSNKTFEVKDFTSGIERIVKVITNLTKTDQLLFDNHDLGHLIHLNQSRLLELVKHQTGLAEEALDEDYVSVSIIVINSILEEMKSSGVEVNDIVLVFKFLESYLHSFNNFLTSVEHKPLSLVVLLNNTEVGKVLDPIFIDPSTLDGLEDAHVHIKKLEKLLEGPNVIEKLCGSELFEAITFPPNKTDALLQLQKRACAVDETVLLWQTIMMQANGYLLYKQIDTLKKEIAEGRYSLNVTGAVHEVDTFFHLLEKVIGGYIDGSRSLGQLLDIQGFQSLFTKAQQTVARRLMDSAAEWSASIVDDVLPLVMGQDDRVIVTRLVATANVLMDSVIDHLNSIQDGNISLSALFGNADQFSQLIQAYIRFGKNLAQAVLDGDLDIDKIENLARNSSKFRKMCKENRLTREISDVLPTPRVVQDLSTLICSIVDGSLVADAKTFIDFDRLESQLSNIWDSDQDKPDFQRLSSNIREFSEIVSHLANSTLTSDVKSLFNFDKALNAFQDILNQPKLIFRMMKLFGLVLEKPLKDNPDVVKLMSGVNSFAIMPLVHVLQHLTDKGLTLDSLGKDPSHLLDALSVFTDFNLHYRVLETTIVKQWVNALAKDKRVCSDSDYRDRVSVRVERLSLPLAWSDVVNILCGTNANTWLDTFTDRGLSQVQKFMLFEKLVENSDASLLPDMYDPDFGWVSLMSSLEKLSALVTDDDGVNKAEQVKSAWESVKDILFDKSLRSILSYIQLAGGSSHQSDAWIRFKQFLQFSKSAFDFLNDNLKPFNRKSVKLEDILPDSRKVSELLEKIVGPSGAAELVVSFIDPYNFYHLTLWSQWDEICREDRLTDYFTFPTGTNVATLKTDLCTAVSARSGSFREFLDLFHAGNMLAELDKLINGEYNQTSDVTVWEAVHSSMMRLVKTVEGLGQAVVNGKSVDTYLKPILDTVMSITTDSQNNQVSMTCMALMKYFNRTDEYNDFQSTMTHAITSLRLITSLTEILPDVDDISCAFINRDRVDLVNGMEKLTNLGLWDDIKDAIENYIDPPNHVDCQEPVRLNDKLSKAINKTLSPTGLDGQRVEKCLENFANHLPTMINSVSNAIGLVNDIIHIMQIPGVRELINNRDLYPLLQSIFDLLNLNKDAIVAVSDLFDDQDGVSQYLLNTLQLPANLVHAFMNATVDKDWTYLFRKPVGIVEEVLCDPDRLSKAIRLPVSIGLDMKDLSDSLCDEHINDTVRFLKNISATVDEIAKMSSGDNALSVVGDLFIKISDMVSRFSNLVELVGNVFFDFSVSSIKDNTDAMDKLVRGSDLKNFAESLDEILEDIKRLVPERGIGRTIISDVRKFIDGIFGLDLLKDMLISQMKVKDLLLNYEAVSKFMTEELGFSPKVTDDIMNGIFSSKMLLGLVDQPSYTCDEVFDMILTVNYSQAQPETIRDAFCSLSDKQLTDLMQKLTRELDLGHLIVNYMKFAGDSILSSTNMTRDELSDMVEKIDFSQRTLVKAQASFRKYPNGYNLLTGFAEGRNSGLQSLAPSFCGKSVNGIFGLNYDTPVIIPTNNDFTDQLENGIQNNIDDLPNKYCVAMYKSIQESRLGGILWTYIKPILRGKILYTPPTALAEQIVSKANATFSLINTVREVAAQWADYTPNLLKLLNVSSDVASLRTALQNEFVKSLVEANTGMKVSSLISGIDALEANNYDKKQIQGLQELAQLVVNYSSCVVVDRFVPVESEEELEKEAFRLQQTKTFFAGVVFENMDGDDENYRGRRQAEGSIPKHIKYKIRMDIENTMDTNRLKSRLWKMQAEDGFIDEMRYLRGFIHIQDMIDKAIIDLHKDPFFQTPGFRLRQIPFPCHHYDSFIFLLGSYLIPIMMTFVFLAALGTATHNLVYDRENGQETTLQVMGMLSGVNVLVWVLSTMLLMSIDCLIIAIMLKYTDVFIYSHLFPLFLYILCFCFSSIMLLFFVSSFFTRTTLAILFVLIFYLLSYLPYILVVSLEFQMKSWQKTLACLASTTAFSFAALNLAYLEESGTGLQFDNIAMEVTKDFSVQWACLMMLIDSAIYFLLGWYIRNIYPGKYGVSQPFYFPLLPSYWCSCFKGSGDTIFTSTLEQPQSELFERGPDDLKVGIAVENLRKDYKGRKGAVENLSINFYEGEITSLLGHNGAAKTTTMKMITGILEPTSGKIYIDGREQGCCRHKLGICPQQNALFDYMTVIQHMEFYCGMKGALVSSEETRRLLLDVDLWHAKDVPARDLSWGMKRRLCVALAFVGDSKTIILDEPTSGVDPHARKNIWNLITRNRHGRTILLSTHHLDEADILSDRIAIMHQGRLLAYGAPTFLKQSLGGGYKLSIIKGEEAEASAEYDNAPSATVREKRSRERNETILSYVKSMCPSAEIVQQVGSDLIINLPRGSQHMNVPFYQFFRQLDENLGQLNIHSYGLSDVTLEEVFLRLTKRADMSRDPGVVNPVMASDSHDLDIQHMEPVGTFDTLVNTRKRKTNISLSFSQALALFTKRFHHYRRNWRILFSAVLMPLIGVVVALAFSTVRPNESHLPPLVLDPAIYGDNVYNFYSDHQKTSISFSSQRYTRQLNNPKLGIGTACMPGVKQLGHFPQESKCTAPGPWYNKTSQYFIGQCYNARQRYLDINSKMTIKERVLDSGQKLQDIGEKNAASYLLNTFRDYKDKRFGGWTFEKKEASLGREADPYVWFNSKGYHAMPSYFNALSNIVLRAQLPLSENQSAYGITAINHPIRLQKAALSMDTIQNDAADAGIAVVIVVAFSFIPSGVLLYLIRERNQKDRQLQFMSGVKHFMYWSVALVWDLLTYSVAVALAAAAVAIFKTDGFYLKDNLACFVVLLLLYGWAVIPMMYAFSRVFNQGSTAYLVSFCLNLFIALATVISLLVMQLFKYETVVLNAYKVLRYVYLIFPQYALGQGLMELVANTFKYKLFKRFDQDVYDNPFSTDVTGYHMIALSVCGFFFFLVTLVVDFYRSSPIKLSASQPRSEYEDEDVTRERERVHTTASDVLKVENFSKIYRRGWKQFLAVNQISFGVPKGECFGLLGVNGAGKTTTFRMLTGDLLASGGAAYLRGRKMVEGEVNSCQEIGYCPQEGGLDDYLSGEEMLYFHARLRGFDRQQTKQLVEELTAMLHLQPYIKKTIRSYSGGTKKKLSLALAMLGQPSILYLDEPTTGMDAGTRRLVWQCIAQANKNGQSVLLTSHSMDECDSLCSKIAIMVNGDIKCIGTPQHLKHKYGDGYTVVMHTKRGNTSAITESFLNKFPGSVIKSKHHTSVEIQVPASSGHISDVIANLQAAEDDHVIDYYSISQTTLDSVFINFAQWQTDSIGDQARVMTQLQNNQSDSGSFSSSEAHSSSDASSTNKSKLHKYVFHNPQFVNEENEELPQPGQEQSYYSNNLLLAATAPEATKL